MAFPPEFDSSGNLNLVYPEVLNLDELGVYYDDTDGDIIQVTNDGTKRWRVYKYVLATNTFLKIGAEKQTFKFIDATYTKTFSVTDSTDFRAIIDAIFENVFTVEWLIKKNEVFFGMIHYVLSEQDKSAEPPIIFSIF